MSRPDNATIAQMYYSGPKNSSYIIPGVYDLTVEDTNWVLTSAFIIFTMQTGKNCYIIRTNQKELEYVYQTKIKY